MTRVHYISPSLVPSPSANSIHVIRQCEGFSQSGIDITLYARRATPSAHDLPSQINLFYGVNAQSWDLVTFHSNISQAQVLTIGAMALGPVLRAPRSDIVLSRNLYCAYALAVLRRPILFETHQLEIGIRKYMQKWIMSRPWVRTVAISRSLVTCLEEYHSTRISAPVVLHDAAPDGINMIEPCDRRRHLARLLNIELEWLWRWDIICGYFGQFHPGRGIEIIEMMAVERPSSLFLLFGGSDAVIAAKKIAAPPNLLFMGQVSHQFSLSVQAAVEVLLMPYQHSVSIGVKGHDTARWMSPMKMFEYLASGVPIICSDLPVLREILIDCKNALLVPPASTDDWSSALDLLINDNHLARSIGKAAHDQYYHKHTCGQLLLCHPSSN